MLLSSFSEEALQAARAAAPGLARGLLVDAVPIGWQARLERLQCVSLHCSHAGLEPETLQAVKAAGYAVLCWTVNDPAQARQLFDWGVDCIVTDALEIIEPDFG